MKTASRRTLLTAAATMAAAAPAIAAAQGDGGSGDDGVLVLPSRAAAMRAKVAAGVGAVLCTGYARSGDRGQALYARVAAEPGHAGKFRSGDGAWWELAENRLNPFMFGARARAGVDDSAAIQAMFDFVAAKATPYPMEFLGARYLVQRPLTLPSVRALAPLDLDGGGGALTTDQPITILSRLPANQGDAMRVINGSPFDIHHLEFRGSGAAGQIGLHIGAAYGNVVRNCHFVRLDYGTIGSFCLGSAWRDNLYLHCARRAAVIQTGRGYDNGEIWPGANETNSASNVNVFENCRVFGHPKQVSAFGIFGSDAARVTGCISEGLGANIDLHFDFQASPTVKQFHVDMFHCEAPNGKLNFKVRASGKVTIERVIRSYPAAIYDAQGSGPCEVVLRGFAWLGELPVATGKGPNPNGRWFYHCDGNGFGAATEAGLSSGMSFRFENCVESAYLQLIDPRHWEGGKLPYMLHVRGLLGGNGGMLEWSNAPISFHSPVSFAQGETFAGIASGKVKLATAMVPAHASVTERFVGEAMGIPSGVTLNPLSTADAPPPGIAWNSYFDADGAIMLRLTNVTGEPIALKPGAVWGYHAPRQR